KVEKGQLGTGLASAYETKARPNTKRPSRGGVEAVGRQSLGLGALAGHRNTTVLVHRAGAYRNRQLTRWPARRFSTTQPRGRLPELLSLTDLLPPLGPRERDLPIFPPPAL